jgi:GR25 family glycosyltransferase involved in LPS biosynthesis
MEENIKKYFDAIDIIYWINLDRADNRRKNMTEMLKNLPVKNERISAIDGKKISLQELLIFFTKRENIENQLNRYEYGCLLSHLNAIKQFSETDYKYALIFEDDVSLEYVKYWNKKISDIINEAPNDWEIIMLNYISNKTPEDLYELNINENFFSAQAYIINNTAAKKFINKYYINFKYDLTEFNKYAADVFIFSLIKTYCYKYPYFTYSVDNDSTIHSDHLDFHKIAKKKAFESWEALENEKKKAYEDNKTFYFNLLLIGLIIIVITLILRLNYRI